MEDCIFCKIIGGEIPCFKLYEDNHTFAFLDAFPGTKGHSLVVPKQHYADIFDTPEELYSHVLHTGMKVAKALKEALNFDGMNFFQNTGSSSGQTVFHLHVHLFPRWTGDHALGGWKASSVKKEDQERIREGVLSYLK